MTLLIAMGTSALLCDALFELLPTVSGDVPKDCLLSVPYVGTSY